MVSGKANIDFLTRVLDASLFEGVMSNHKHEETAIYAPVTYAVIMEDSSEIIKVSM